MQTLYKHQERFLERNPNRAMLVWETGTGKTVAACLWMNKRNIHRALVVCPKGIIGKWKRDLDEWQSEADVISRDEIKRHDLSPYDVLVLDEAQDFAAPLFDKSRSQRATVVYNYVKAHPKAHILLLTATPIRSTPWNIHTLACYLGYFWPIKEFRNKFFHMTDLYGRLHYEKNKGWQTAIRPYIEKISDIVLMRDCVDVPAQTSEVVAIPWDGLQENSVNSQYLEPVAEWHERHRAENGKKKFAELERILNGYRKAIVVCHYRSQIDDYISMLGDRQVFVLHGDTKDQDKTIQDARAADDCVFIIQAQMGAGFDAGEFSVVIFASMSFRYVDHVQMKGRVKRINNLHENHFIYMLGGECDRAVFKSIKNNQDFDVHHYLGLK